MNIIQVGTKWQGGDNKFQVTNITEEQENTWVHYKNIKTEQTYNCYIEAFLSRFNRVPE
jgi:hypothetical protein